MKLNFTPEQREQFMAELRSNVIKEIMPDLGLRHDVLDPLITAAGFAPTEATYRLVLLGATLGLIGRD